MISHPEKHLKKLRAVSLTQEERRETRDALTAYMEYHPFRALDLDKMHAESAHVLQKAMSRGGIWGLFSNRATGFLAATLIVILMGGGISFAAEGTTPDKLLYPVKVGVTEEVRGWFALGDEAKVAWEARLVERRLEEAETLAASGKLSAEMRAEIALRFKEHAEEVAKRLARLESRSHGHIAARMSSQLESSLRAHEHVLLSFEEEHSSEEVPYAVTEALTVSETNSGDVVVSAKASPLVAQVRLSIGDIEAIRLRTESGVFSTTSFESSLTEEERVMAAEAIAEAKGSLDRYKGLVSADIIARVRERLRIAERAYDSAEARLEDNAEAVIELHEAIRAATEASVLIRTQARIGSGGKPGRIETTINGETDIDELHPSTTPSGSGVEQGAAVVNVSVDTNTNTSSTQINERASTTTTSDTETSNESDVQTDIRININTGGL